VVDDFVNVRDFAPTFLELAGVAPHPQMTGWSLMPILRSEESGWIQGDREVMLVGKERHDIGRPHDWGYPVRAIRTREWLYVHNFHPERWPAGNPETDFGNCDPSPTKNLLKAMGGYYYDLSFGKRPADELYRISDDPECVRNLANDLAYAQTIEELRRKMMFELRNREKDPRALGNAAVFDTYKYVGSRAKGYDTWLKTHEAKTAEELRPAESAESKKKKRQAQP
jgi:arylsulfatase A-like enzyme